MKVYVVKNIWRNDDDWDCDLEVFESADKAKKYAKEEFMRMCEDYNIAHQHNIEIEDNMNYDENDFILISNAEQYSYYYTDYNLNCFDIFVLEKEVK